jgi:hypothetical protein
MKSSNVATILLVLTTAGGMAAYVKSERGRSDKEMSQLRDKVAMLTDSMNRDEQVDRAASTNAPTQRTPVPYGDRGPPTIALSASATSVGPGVASTDKPLRRAPAPGAVRNGLEVAFISDQPDPKWGTLERGTLMKKFDSVLSDNSSITSLDCRSSMCRMQTRHADLGAFKKFLQSAFIDANSYVVNGAAHVSLLSDPSAQGPVDAVEFLAREGRNLPFIEPD